MAAAADNDEGLLHLGNPASVHVVSVSNAGDSSMFNILELVERAPSSGLDYKFDDLRKH